MKTISRISTGLLALLASSLVGCGPQDTGTGGTDQPTTTTNTGAAQSDDNIDVNSPPVVGTPGGAPASGASGRRFGGVDTNAP